MSPTRAGESRRRASHSMEAVLTEAVALLDEAGQSGLTFRALAERLGGGVASIYWYVANKEELLDRATDFVLAAVLVEVEAQPETDDAIADLRRIAVTLFDATVARPWLGEYFLRNTVIKGNTLGMYEKLGQQTLRLNLTALQRFYAVSAIVGFVVGTAADLGQEPPQEVLEGTTSREEFMARFADSWRQLDPTEFPFVHDIVEVVSDHDDREQFLAGLDLTLAGLRLQAE